LSKEKEKNDNLGKELNLGPLNLREILTIASDFLFGGGWVYECKPIHKKHTANKSTRTHVVKKHNNWILLIH
jgi:hypothetical protein